MADQENSLKWIIKGYELLAVSGPDGVKVERIARMLNVNKSAFYHYFGDREIFFEQLMDHHDKIGVQFAKEVSELKSFNPGYPNLLIKYKTSVFIQMMLRKHKDVPVLYDTFIRVRNRNNKVQIPLWAKYIDIQDTKLAEELFDFTRDKIFSQMSITDLAPDSFSDMFEEIRLMIKKIRAV